MPILTIEDVKRLEQTLLFHGTMEEFDTPRPASGGGLLWLAFSSAVAQSYIPEAGVETIFSPRFTRNRADVEVLSPPDEHSSLYEIYRDIGIADAWSNVEYDNIGRPKSYRIEREVTRDEFLERMALLGYAPDGDSSHFRVSFRVKTDRGRLLRADEKIVGRLFIFEGMERLNLLDASKGEDDLMDPTYNKLDQINAMRKRGYDGVQIDDFLQSREWGNFGHRSIALFDTGLAKLAWNVIPASNYDPKTMQEWREPTPEFAAYAERLAEQVEATKLP